MFCFVVLLSRKPGRLPQFLVLARLLEPVLLLVRQEVVIKNIANIFIDSTIFSCKNFLRESNPQPFFEKKIRIS